MTSPDPAPSVPPESLLEHRDWVRRLARCLAGRVTDPDDLEQDVWLAAMRRPPSHDTGLRSWFRRVMGNRVRELHRQGERRDRREREAAVSDEAPPTGDAVAEIEAHGRLVQAVLGLDEPYRTTLVLRFFRELPPREVAARMGVPVETARTRVKRGLKLLRQELDEGGGTARVLVPLLGLPDQAWPQVGGAASTGGIAMAVTGKQVAGVAALVLCGVGMAVGVDVWQRDGAVPVNPGDVLSTIEVADLEERDLAAGDRERPRVPRRGGDTEMPDHVDGGLDESNDPLPPPGAEGGTGTVVGRVVAPDGDPVEGIALASAVDPALAWVRTGADGRFRLEGVPAGRPADLILASTVYRYTIGSASVESAPEGSLPVVRADEVTDEVVLRLERYARIRVHGTIDCGGEAVVGAQISAASFNTNERANPLARAFIAISRGRRKDSPLAEEIGAGMRAALEGSTDAAGRYELDLPAAVGSFSVSVRAPGFLPGTTRPVHMEPGRSEYVRNLTLERATSVTGTVTCGDTGAPAAGAEFLLWSSRTNSHSEVAVTVDGSGQFELPAGTLSGVLRHPGYLDEPVRLRATAEPPRITLVPRRRIAGRVVFPDGTPLTGVTVRLSNPDTAPVSRRGPASRPSVGTDGNGAFEFSELWDAEWKLKVSDRAGNDQSFVARTLKGVPAGTADLVVEVQPALVIEGTVVDDAGEPAAGAALNVFAEFGESGLVAQELTGRDGRFRLQGLQSGSYRVTVSASTQSATGFVALELTGVEAGRSDLRVEVSRGLSFVGRVVDAAARPVAGRKILAIAGDPAGAAHGGALACKLDAQGRFRITGVPVGDATYRLQLAPQPPDYSLCYLLGGEAVRPGATALELTLTSGGTLAGRVLDHDGTPCVDLQVSAMRASDRKVMDRHTYTDAQGHFEIRGLPPGHRHVLHVLHKDRLPVLLEGVAPGTLDVEIRFDRGLSISGVVHGRNDRPLGPVRLTLVPDDGSHARVVMTDWEGRFELAGLARGTCRVTGKSGRDTFDLGTVDCGASGVILRRE